MPTMTLAEFARHITRCANEMPRRERKALDAAGHRLEMRARSYIGHYQGEQPPFPAWKPLSDATLHGGIAPSGYRYPGKVELGYSPPDNPLLRTGEMRASLSHEVRRRSVILGSPDQIAFWQEFGTRYMPPRSFIGRALAERAEIETKLIAWETLRPLLTGRF